MKLSKLYELVNDIEVVKDIDFNMLGMATTRFTNESILTFLSDEKFANNIFDNKNIVAIMTTKEIFKKGYVPEKYGIILSHDPKAKFYEVHNKLSETEFYWKKFDNRISKTSIIHENAVIDLHSVEIGENTVIESGVVIHSGSIIGDNVIIRSGSQIGTSGFQFLNEGGSMISVATSGQVIIKDGVEIQHNCCVDRGVFGGNTVLEEEVKLDNFVHVAHDNIIGKSTLITAGVKLGGRVIVGQNCWLGINATITNGITIGDNSRISLGSVVTQSVPSNAVVSGNFAIDHAKFIQFIKSIR